MSYFQCSHRGSPKCQDRCPYNIKGYYKGNIHKFSCPVKDRGADPVLVPFSIVHRGKIRAFIACLLVLLLLVATSCFHWYRLSCQGSDDISLQQQQEIWNKFKNSFQDLDFKDDPQKVQLASAHWELVKEKIPDNFISDINSDVRNAKENFEQYANSWYCVVPLKFSQSASSHFFEKEQEREKMLSSFYANEFPINWPENKSDIDKFFKEYEIIGAKYAELKKGIDFNKFENVVLNVKNSRDKISEANTNFLEKIDSFIKDLNTYIDFFEGNDNFSYVNNYINNDNSGITFLLAKVQETKIKGILREYFSRINEQRKDVKTLVLDTNSKIKVRRAELVAAEEKKRAEAQKWNEVTPIFRVLTHKHLSQDLCKEVISFYLQEQFAIKKPFPLPNDAGFKVCGELPSGDKCVVQIVTGGHDALKEFPKDNEVWITGSERDDIGRNQAFNAFVVAMDAMMLISPINSEITNSVNLIEVEKKLPAGFIENYRSQADTSDKLLISENLFLQAWSKRDKQNAKSIPIQLYDGHMRPLAASGFTIKTEEYAITKRILCYVSANPTLEVARFEKWLKQDGLKEISNLTQFVDQILNIQQGRLGFNFYFAHKGSEMDYKGNRDLERLVDLLVQQKQQWKIVLVGHASTIGESKANLKYGLERAKTVKKALEVRKVPFSVEAYSVGSQLPVLPDVDSNKEEIGSNAARNRRVEVWIMDKNITDVKSVLKLPSNCNLINN